MLTIGQLAALVGVTVRAIRHYHQRGLLPEPEPERDASGYRRYDAGAAIDDPHLACLADEVAELIRRLDRPAPDDPATTPYAAPLLAGYAATMSPAWQALESLVRERLDARGDCG